VTLEAPRTATKICPLAGPPVDHHRHAAPRDGAARLARFPPRHRLHLLGGTAFRLAAEADARRTEATGPRSLSFVERHNKLRNTGLERYRASLAGSRQILPGQNQAK
jgi:hypothetical protein